MTAVSGKAPQSTQTLRHKDIPQYLVADLAITKYNGVGPVRTKIR
jgi:hypothetical protein